MFKVIKTIKTLEQGVKYVQSQQQRHQNDAIGIDGRWEILQK